MDTVRIEILDVLICSPHQDFPHDPVVMHLASNKNKDNPAKICGSGKGEGGGGGGEEEEAPVHRLSRQSPSFHPQETGTRRYLGGVY